MQRSRLGDYRFDLGPTFLMMKFLLDELFAEGGRRSTDYLQFKKLDPMYELRFHDKMHAGSLRSAGDESGD